MQHSLRLQIIAQTQKRLCVSLHEHAHAAQRLDAFDAQDVGSLFRSLFDSAEDLDDQAEMDVVVAARCAHGDLGREETSKETSETDAAQADAGAADDAEPNWLD